MNVWLRNFILLALMVAASAGAVAMRPTRKIADQGQTVALETMIPRDFSGWREVKQPSAYIVDPQQQASLDKIYTQVLTRTYVNGRGQAIMLSIAYGSNQSDDLQVHRPEICYSTQGFQILSQNADQLTVAEGVIPIERVLAVQGKRREPITYWIIVGDKATNSGVGQKLAQLRFGFTGRIPDGMLVRVSTIDDNDAESFKLEDGFVREMLAAMDPADRKRLTGRLGS